MKVNIQIRIFCLLVLLVLGSAHTFSQEYKGTIKYDRTLYYSKVIESLPYLSEEERDRQKLTWGKDEGWAHPYELRFTPEQTIYTYGEQERENAYSWRKDEFLLVHNLSDNKILHQRVMGGDLFVIEDEAPKYKWKILNEIREVAGRICFKAETVDPIKKQTIHAWFTNEIPVSAGPEGYGGLPGMILMLVINDGTAIIEATEIELSEPLMELPKKIKGKRIEQLAYNEKMKKYFKQCIDGERNPYWRIRY